VSLGLSRSLAFGSLSPFGPNLMERPAAALSLLSAHGNRVADGNGRGTTPQASERERPGERRRASVLIGGEVGVGGTDSRNDDSAGNRDERGSDPQSDVRAIDE
jgi:hypothetical protein